MTALLERFYDPTAGSVTLDGTDLRELNVRWLRQQIGLVMQEPKLFGKSIKENIAIGAPGITQDQIEQAARLANAHDFIVSFPKGYDTQVGDLGGMLSGKTAVPCKLSSRSEGLWTHLTLYSQVVNVNASQSLGC